MFDLHRVDGPDDKSESGNGAEKLADLAALGHSLAAAVNSEVPDNDEVGNASNGVPAPLLGSSLAAECGKETSQDHDEIGDNGHEDVTAAKASKESEVEEKERSSNRPVNVTGVVHFRWLIMGSTRRVQSS